MSQAAPEPAPQGRALWHLLASVLAPLGIFVFLAWHSHGAILAQADRRVRQNTAILHAHAQKVFEINTMALDRIGDYIRLKPSALAEDAGDARDFLLQVKNQSPALQLLWVFDASGAIVATTAPVSMPKGPVVTDRDSFRHHQAHPGPGLFVTRPLIGQVYGGEQFAMTRRLSAADGSFLGMATTTVLARSLVESWRDIDPELQSTVSLVRDDGVILVRNPPVPIDTPPLAPDMPIMRALRDADAGLLKPVSPLDGMVRITGFQRLQGVPVWIAHSVALVAVQAQWHRALLTYGLLCGSASLALVATGLLALRQARRVHSLTRALADAKATLEDRVRERTAELARALRQRDLLLREVYHRVKNKLQIVDSLMMMESRRLADPEAKTGIENLRSRIHALGLVHQHLMLSDDLETLDIAPFLRELVDGMAVSFDLARSGIAVSVAAAPVRVNLDFATPIGLIVTELVINTVKHAQGATALAIEFRQEPDGGARLVVRDNAPLPDGDGASPAPGASGTGSRIVDSLTRQLRGRMTVSYDHGRCIEVSMPLAETIPC